MNINFILKGNDDMIKLTQDNGSCNNIPFTKITVELLNSELEEELRKYFGWRKDVTRERLNKLGSSDYDKFIKYLSEQGY